jgi:hypothetical protein
MGFGEQARIGWFFDLLFFEAAGVVCQSGWVSVDRDGTYTAASTKDRMSISKLANQ